MNRTRHGLFEACASFCDFVVRRVKIRDNKKILPDSRKSIPFSESILYNFFMQAGAYLYIKLRQHYDRIKTASHYQEKGL